MFFVSYMCFSFPNYAQTSKSHRKEKKNLLLIKDGEQGGVCVGGYFFVVVFYPSSKIRPHALYVWYCLCAFPPIARAALAWRAGKKDSSLTAFDVHVLWSHVSALSVKSFCCPSA